MHVYFENIIHTSQHHDDSSGGNPTVESNTQPLNASVTPNKSHIPIRLKELVHNTQQQLNLTKLSHHEKLFKDGFDSDNFRGPFMGAVDEEYEKYFEEELLRDNKEVSNANEDNTITITIPTPEEPTLTKDEMIAMNMKEVKAELKNET